MIGAPREFVGSWVARAACMLFVAGVSMPGCSDGGGCVVGETIDCKCKGGGVSVVCGADGTAPPCLCSGGGGGADAASSGGFDWSKDKALVVDAVQGLMWQREVPPQSLAWQPAKAYCDELVLGGYDDWILPHRDELMTLVLHTTTAPAIDTAAFPNTPAKPFWTRTLYAPRATTHAWGVDFEDGGDGYAPFAELHRVRCVRKL